MIKNNEDLISFYKSSKTFEIVNKIFFKMNVSTTIR